MKKKVFIITLLFLFLNLISASAFISEWNVLKTDNFEVFYPDGYYHYAEESLYYLEEYRREMMVITGNDDDFKSRVLIHDMGLLANGYADHGDAKMGMMISTPNSYILSSNESRVASLALHELTHLAQFQNASGTPGILSNLAGNYYSPNIYHPRWISEGIAIYGESLPSNYQGRLNDGYYHALLRDEIKNDNLPELVDVSYKRDDYFYGALFFDYLAKEYGEDSLANFFREHSYNEFGLFGLLFPRIGFDRSAIEVYGKGFKELFVEWQEYEIENYIEVEQDKEILIDSEGGKILDLIIKNDKVYYFKEEIKRPSPFRQMRIYSLREYNLASGEDRTLKKLASRPTGLLQIKDEKLYYSLRDIRRGFANTTNIFLGYSGYGRIANLYSYDLVSEDTELIFSDTFKDFAILIKDEVKIVYAKKAKGGYGSEIWHYKAEEKKKLGSVDYEILELEASDKGLITVSKKQGQPWGINILDLDNLSFSSLVESPYIEKFIKVDKEQLYFTANYEGYYRPYRYDLNDDKLVRLIDSYYASNGLLYEDKLYNIGLNDGNVIYKALPLEREYSVSGLENDNKNSLEKDSDFNYELDYAIQNDSASKDNFKYLLKPYLKFPFIAAKDGLGLNHYEIDYLGVYQGSRLGKPSMNLSSELLNPIVIDFRSLADSYNLSSAQINNYLKISYPNYGLFSETDFDSIRLGSEANLSYLEHELKSALVWDDNQKKLVTAINYSYSFFNSSLNLKFREFADFRNKYRTERLYFDDNQDYNYHFALDYKHKLFAIDKGFWNPNVFVGNVYGNLFVEGAETDSYDSFSAGYEFQFETGVGFDNQILPTLGFYTSNRDEADSINPYFRFGRSF